MRKSSKLLAVLLTLCLLFGAITAIFVSAEGETAATPVLDVTNAVHNASDSFTGKTGGHLITDTAYKTVVENNVPGLVYHNPTFATGLYATYKTDASNNTYARIHTAPAGSYTTSATQTYGSFGWRVPFVNSNTDEKRWKQDKFRGYTYVTYDFDFAIDQNRYLYNNVWYTEDNATEEIKNGATKIEPAMPDEIGFYPLLLKSTAADSEWTTSGTGIQVWSSSKLWIKKFSGGLYASFGAKPSNSADCVKISDEVEVGTFNHFTYVFAVSNVTESSYDLTPHIYVNGVHIATGASMSFNYANFLMMYGEIYSRTKNSKQYEDHYSLALDNIAVNYYTETNNFDVTKPLYEQENTVYNEGYVSPNGYVEIDGKKYSIPEVVNKKLAALEGDETTITVSGMNLTNVELPDNIKSLTVTCENDGTFALGSKCGWRYTKSTQDNVDTYTRVIDGDVMASVQLFSDVMRFKIYIPLSENVSYKASYSTADGSSINANIKDGGLHTDNGVTYQVIFWGSRMDMFSTTAYAEFEYNDGTTTTPLLARFTANFDTLEYATLVAKDTQTYPCGSEGARLVKAMTDYRVALMEEVRDVNTRANNQLNNNADRINTFNNIYTEHGAGCTCGTYEPEDKNLPDDQKYINVGVKQENLTLPEGVSVTFGLDTDNGVFYLIVNSTVEDGDCVFVSYTGYDGERGGKEADIVNGVANLNGLNFSAADIDNAFTISICKVTYEEVKDKDGNVVMGEDGNPVTKPIRTAIETFNYSLADYSTTGDYADLVTALRNYALAAENYKKDLKEAN